MAAWAKRSLDEAAEGAACGVAERLAARLSRLETGHRRVVVGVCGSVAAVKTAELCGLFREKDIDVDFVFTAAALRFVQAARYKGERIWDKLHRVAKHEPPGAVLTWLDEDEWTDYTDVGVDAVLHIELCRHAAALVLAPLDANTLAKAALGLCDNLVSCIVRAWPFGLTGTTRVPKPFIVAPAMNTVMWEQSITSEHLAQLRGRGAHIVHPREKVLACGDKGTGALAPVAEVVQAVCAHLTTVAETGKKHVEGDGLSGTL